MTVPNRLTAIVAALRSAGATEEIIAAAVKAVGTLGSPHGPRAADRTSMSMGRRASALIDGVTKPVTKLLLRVTKSVTKHWRRYETNFVTQRFYGTASSTFVQRPEL
jgi:hypothetical protein